MKRRDARSARLRAEMKNLGVEAARVPLLPLGLAVVAAVSAASTIASLSTM
ncbi:hypothetical protein [Enterovirga aerilata]|uniref:Uncharacterized protein n=1 Tax=Enterovirga aerilata TaxID=2730920 RepID=A0A849I4J4_9HYPH|nr:hypothetical protein [Enterovirga sp. DB1703]NNM72278.1 hypothetical protein [Enterovirga sp. DB1703]